MHKFLIHHTGDHVGVAVADIAAGEMVSGVSLDTDEMTRIKSLGDIPLGHKIALTDLPEGTPVLKYGVQIGLTTAPVRAGDYVHTHNIKTARW